MALALALALSAARVDLVGWQKRTENVKLLMLQFVIQAENEASKFFSGSFLHFSYAFPLRIFSFSECACACV